MAKKEPGKVITIMNMKGGVGKTTTTINFSTTLVGKKLNDKFKRVLIIDYDPQFNLSQSFFNYADYDQLLRESKSILSILQDDNSQLDLCTLQTPMSTSGPNLSSVTETVLADQGWLLDIVPSTLDLMPLAVSSSNLATKIMAERFSKMIAQAKAQYDLILIDCHPSGSLFTKTAITESNHILVPVTPNDYAERGISLMIDFISQLFMGKDLPQLHILLNNISSDDKAFATRLTISRHFKKYVLKQRLPSSKLISKSNINNGFLYQSKGPHSIKVKSDMENVINELLAKV
ncbi:ParA family protein [Vibrio atlanticus]|uniref:ParA family protein n=1 Tax=Vibrio atlanticus TaxID=693153 RepID=UPI001428B639|nr:ParA family protein [Vibrio atlanticus]